MYILFFLHLLTAAHISFPLSLLSYLSLPLLPRLSPFLPVNRIRIGHFHFFSIAAFRSPKMKMKRWLLQLSIIMGCSAFQQDAKQAPDEGDPMEVVEFNVDVLYERRDYFLEEDIMKIELEAAKHAFEKDVLEYLGPDAIIEPTIVTEETVEDIDAAILAQDAGHEAAKHDFEKDLRGSKAIIEPTVVTGETVADIDAPTLVQDAGRRLRRTQGYQRSYRTTVKFSLKSYKEYSGSPYTERAKALARAWRWQVSVCSMLYPKLPGMHSRSYAWMRCLDPIAFPVTTTTTTAPPAGTHICDTDSGTKHCRTCVNPDNCCVRTLAKDAPRMVATDADRCGQHWSVT